MSSLRVANLGSRRNDQVLFVFVSSVKGTSLSRGKEHFFGVGKPNFDLLSGDTLALNIHQSKWLQLLRHELRISLKSMY